MLILKGPAPNPDPGPLRPCPEASQYSFKKWKPRLLLDTKKVLLR